MRSIYFEISQKSLYSLPLLDKFLHDKTRNHHPRRFPIRQIKIQFRFLMTIFDNHKELSDRNSSNLNTGISEKQIFITNDYTICIHSFNKETSNCPISPSVNPAACAMSFIESPICFNFNAVERLTRWAPSCKHSI